MGEVGRLQWKCRRGMKELDLVLLDYLHQRYSAAAAAEQQAFESLLEQQDPTLFAYLTGRERPADEHQRHVIDALRRTT